MIVKEYGIPVTTTNNGGAGLDSPKLPIGKQNVFRRASILLKKKKLELPKS